MILIYVRGVLALLRLFNVLCPPDIRESEIKKISQKIKKRIDKSCGAKYKTYCSER